MAQLTQFNDFGTQGMFSGDDFFNSIDAHQQDWDLSSEEGHEFELEESSWGQIDEQGLDFDEMDDFEEDIDNFHGAF